MNKPLVSLIILTYQHESYIKDCIMGILAQTYSPIELLILDDASTDKTWDILNQYMPILTEKCIRVEMIRHQLNSGNISHNLNEMLFLCKGDYIKIFAGDDVLCANCLEHLVNYLEENPQDILAYSNGYIIPNTWHWGENPSHKFLLRNHRIPASENMLEEVLLRNYIPPAPSVMLRRDVFCHYGYYDESIVTEDYQMWCKLAHNGQHFGFTNEKLVYYRESATGISRKKMSRKIFVQLQNNVRVRIVNQYLPFITKEKRIQIIERHLSHEIAVAKKNRLYDLALILWLRKRKLSKHKAKGRS